MHILLTALSAACLIGCFLAYTRSQIESDRALAFSRTADAIALKLRAERDRVTVLEREVDALRRELRKLSGKFYATQREEPARVVERHQAEFELDPALNDNPPLPICENWERAKLDGPGSVAAACPCGYCERQRAARAVFRSRVLPKTVQGQAELARLNASKP